MDFELLCMIIVALLVICAIALLVIKFIVLPSDQQQKKIKLILLDLVLKAEAALGSKTGRAKRAQVYNLLIEKIPFLIFFMSEEQYDDLLDDTLEEMKDILSNNNNLKEALNIE